MKKVKKSNKKVYDFLCHHDPLSLYSFEIILANKGLYCIK